MKPQEENPQDPLASGDSDRPAGSDENPVEAATPSTAAGNPNFKPRTDANAPKGKTLYLKVDGEGNPDWSRMTSKTAETWKGVLSHNATREAFGETSEAAAAIDKGPSDFESGATLAMIAFGEAALLAKVHSIPLKKAIQLCEWTPDELQSLQPRVRRLLLKYGAEAIEEFGDEAFLILGILGGGWQRWQAASETARQIRAEADRDMRTVEAEKKQPGQVIQ